MIVLHAHLPFVRHADDADFLEERWFYETLVESHLPLLRMCQRLAGEGVRCKIALSLSPTLLEMWADPLLQGRARRYVTRQGELARAEQLRHAHVPELSALARGYAQRADDTLEFYDSIDRNPARAFARVAHAGGGLELLTTAATHPFMPFYAPFPSLMHMQVALGQACFRRHVGMEPVGLWTPECGYYDGLGQVLAAHGVRYTFLESHGLLHATPRPTHGHYKPVRMPNGVVAFARDPEVARMVWSRTEGYPGHADYREFHHDVVHDLPDESVREFVHPAGLRFPTGIKYQSVSKALYDPLAAARRARVDARDFVDALRARCAKVGAEGDFAPLIVAPFDAELFGHWWHEGVAWLEEVIRLIDHEPDIQCVTPLEYLSTCGGLQEVRPGLSSWGSGGYGGPWLQGYGDLAGSMQALCARLTHAVGEAATSRALDMALRECLCAQASDWPFMMQRGDSASYARARLMEHMEACNRMLDMVERGGVDEAYMEKREEAAPFKWAKGLQQFCVRELTKE